jgi:hypothetical protein
LKVERSLRVKRLLPVFQERRILAEGDVTMVSEVRTEEKDLVRVLRLHRGGTGAEHSVDTAHAVAYLPRGLKDVIRLHYELFFFCISR